MITLSLLVNVIVLIPICAGLYLRFPNFVAVFGEDTTARQILMCIYLAILVISGGLLIDRERLHAFLIPLLSIQIFYKLATVLFIKNKKTPVLWFNLVIAFIHSATLYFILVI